MTWTATNATKAISTAPTGTAHSSRRTDLPALAPTSPSVDGLASRNTAPSRPLPTKMARKIQRATVPPSTFGTAALMTRSNAGSALANSAPKMISSTAPSPTETASRRIVPPLLPSLTRARPRLAQGSARNTAATCDQNATGRPVNVRAPATLSAAQPAAASTQRMKSHPAARIVPTPSRATTAAPQAMLAFGVRASRAPTRTSPPAAAAAVSSQPRPGRSSGMVSTPTSVTPRTTSRAIGLAAMLRSGQWRWNELAGSGPIGTGLSTDSGGGGAGLAGIGAGGIGAGGIGAGRFAAGLFGGATGCCILSSCGRD